MMDLINIRKNFPILNSNINGHSLVYLDNAATTQKPRSVIESMNDFYFSHNANVKRGAHSLVELATTGYEESRKTVQEFIGAQLAKEIIFCKGTTEAINMLAWSFVYPKLQKGDEIIISILEHHSNILPWISICKKRGAHLKVVPIHPNGKLDIEMLKSFISYKTKFISISHMSNVLGLANPVEDVIKLAHSYNIPIMIDGAQAVSHRSIDVSILGCDFYVFSGHKMYGPYGVGVLYGRIACLEQMKPYQEGGGMVKYVNFNDEIEYEEIPYKFEAGTQNVSSVIGLKAAIEYIKVIGIQNIESHEKALIDYLLLRMKDIDEIHVLGEFINKISIVAFYSNYVHAHDLGDFLNSKGVAVRVGHHCASPLMDYYKISASVRISLGLYNTKQEIDYVIDVLKQALVFFK